jgi:hypothetical protein
LFISSSVFCVVVFTLPQSWRQKKERNWKCLISLPFLFAALWVVSTTLIVVPRLPSGPTRCFIDQDIRASDFRPKIEEF